MTNSDEQNCQRFIQHQLSLLRSCLKLAQTKTGLLMRHDLGGLEAILKQPDKTYTGYVESGGRRYFQAIYADVAVAQACIGCHNAHPNSPRRDFKLNDVMGGIVITLPMSP